MATQTEAVMPYPMLRGSDQVERVSLVQYVWKQTLGYQLHPQIPAKLSSIADVATASGLWLCDLSQTRTDFERVDGFDVSSASFLPPRDLPQLVRLRVADASQPALESARGRYDVVHVRLIQPGVRDGDPSKIIRHCMDLLHWNITQEADERLQGPGGYLQWEEFDTADFDVHVEDGVTRPSNLEQMIKLFTEMAPNSWIREIPQRLEAHGMIPIAVERMRELPWLRQQMAHLLARVMSEIARARLDVTGPPGAGDALRAQAKGGVEEAMQGCSPGFLFQVVVAQKPV